MTPKTQTEQTGIALVTGAAQRIGKAMTEHLAAKGWDAAIHYNRSSDEATALAAELSRQYPRQRFMTFRADLLLDHQVAVAVRHHTGDGDVRAPHGR